MKVVVFDLDGTLVDSFEDIARAANYALARQGRAPLSTQEIRKHVGRGLENLLVTLMPGAPDSAIGDAVNTVKGYYHEHPADCSVVYPGFIETLDRLGEMKVHRAILSNKVHPIVVRIAEILGLSQRVEAIWGHREGYPLKPDPTSLMEILRLAGASPSECVVVGDASPDEDLARNAGTRFCAVTWGMTPREGWELRNGDWLVESPEVLCDLIRPAMRGRIPE